MGLDLKTATPEMVDEILTEDVKKAVEQAVKPAVQKFNENYNKHGVFAAYELVIKVADGERWYASVYGSIGSQWKKALKVLRSMRAE